MVANQNETLSEVTDPALPASNIHLHPRYAAKMQQKTEQLIVAYRTTRSTALDLIDRQIANMFRGEHELASAPPTLVIAALAETRVKLLALNPTERDAGETLTEIITKLRSLVRQPGG